MNARRLAELFRERAVRATPKVRAEVGAEDLAWAVEAIGRAESLALEVAS